MQDPKIQVISITDNGRETRRYVFKNCNDFVEVPLEEDLPGNSDQTYCRYKSGGAYFKADRKTRSIFGPLVIFPYRSVDLKPISIWEQLRLKMKQRRRKNELKRRSESEPAYKFKILE